MKIGLLTMVFNNNYGGLMQAFALQTYLKNLGHDVYLINAQKATPPILQAPYTILKRLFLKYVLRRPIDPVIPIWAKPKRLAKLERNTRDFIDTYIQPKTKFVTTNRGIKKVGQGFDCYVVGSDQVWRNGMYPFIKSAFLGFVKQSNTIKISYSASFGVGQWTFSPQETMLFKKQINDFDGVSVREHSAVTLCKKYFDLTAQLVLDPTMLLEKDSYLKLIDKEDHRVDCELFSYVLDESEDKGKIIKSLSKRLNLKVSDFFEGKNMKDFVFPSVSTWLASFYRAKYIFTDSFHGCVFAILFNKPFLVYGNKIRGLDRFTSLLEIFHLKERLILSYDEFQRIDPLERIDWERVNLILDDRRQFSKEFIVDSLKNKHK